MKQWESYLIKQCFQVGNDAVVTTDSTREVVNLAVQQVLEQIEDAKLSELGGVIEKIKQEYK